MNIGIIVGSMQQESNSAKVGRYLADQLSTDDHSSYTLDLGKTPLPLWDNSIWSGDEDWKKRLTPINDELTRCDGFIIIAPEYHGMAPAALKNFFMCFGHDSLGHKPGYIVTVSAGVGGTYPIAELRMSSYKNNRLCYTPEHCIVRHAGDVLNEDVSKNDVESDRRTRRRLDYGLNILIEYAKALMLVRDSGVIDHDSFGNGM